MLQLPIRDCTSGFRCFRADLLAALTSADGGLVGYAYAIETNLIAHLAGARVREVPIRFVDRKVGKSKMSAAIAWEAFCYLLRHRRPPVSCPSVAHAA